jgi:hypothetical protein
MRKNSNPIQSAAAALYKVRQQPHNTESSSSPIQRAAAAPYGEQQQPHTESSSSPIRTTTAAPRREQQPHTETSNSPIQTAAPAAHTQSTATVPFIEQRSRSAESNSLSHNGNSPLQNEPTSLRRLHTH